MQVLDMVSMQDSMILVNKAYKKQTQNISIKQKHIYKAETYLQSIFPYLNFDNYILKVTHGDAGQTSFNYYADKTPKENQARDFGWTSPLLDSHIDITISRNLLDKFLYNE